MQTPSRTYFAVAVALFFIGSVSMAHAAQPPPEATDPVKLDLMKGFPSPADKVARLSTVLKFPNGRWAFHHMRELGPTEQVWRGDDKASVARESLQDQGPLRLEDDKGSQVTLADWQRTTFTDGLLVLHKGSVVYRSTAPAWRPCSRMPSGR